MQRLYMLLPVVIILLRKKMRRRYYKWASNPINENQLNHFIMNEEFLHYLWKYRLLEPELRTVSGDRLIIIHPGEHNRDGGPDFFNARLKINNTTWAGNVEIHVQASGWYKHKHHEDSAYDNIILHAVYDNDVDVKRLSEEKIPALVMKGHFPDYIYERYRYFQENSQWVPCQALIPDTDLFILEQWLPALVVERLEKKILVMKQSLEASKFDWEEIFYQNLAGSFGFRINAQPFELLARSLPWKLLLKHRTNLFQLEALLFGQAGMLGQDFSEDYPRLLQQEYRFLRKKYGLREISGSLWKFLRLRPSNFPTVRIAQFADLIHSAPDLFLSALECRDPKSMIDFFTVQASSYWDTHFLFGRLSTFKRKLLGISSIRLLIVNMVVPFLFLYGDTKAVIDFKEKALAFLESLPPEDNAIINHWMEIGIFSRNALCTQALLHLKRDYCDKKRCLECRIGKQLLGARKREDGGVRD